MRRLFGKNPFRKAGTHLLAMGAALLLAGCPGNGGASYSGGATYGSGPSSSPASASDIMAHADSGDIEGIIQLITSGPTSSTGASGGTEQTSEVEFDADAIGLPAGGSVTLTVTVDGSDSSYTATAGSDGKVTLNIPAVPTGASVTVRMDVRDSDGKLVLTGNTSKTVTTDDSSLAVTLSDKVDVQLSVPSNVTCYVYRTSSDGGSTWEYKKATGPDAFAAKLGADVTVEGFALVSSEERLYKFSAASCLGAEGASLQLELDGTQKMDKDSPSVFYTASENSIGYNLGYITPLLNFQNEGLFSVAVLAYSYTTDGSTWLAATLTGAPGDYQTGSVSTTLSAGNQIQLVSRVTLGDGSVDWQTVRTI